MAEAEPRLSFVVASRNDNHGGNLLERMRAFVDCLRLQMERRRLSAELVLVEWNPTAGRPSLAQALALFSNAALTCRVITVSSSLHAGLPNADHLPLHQMIAKNVGIRRARGQWVVATNIDIILSDALTDHLAGPLSSGTLYRTERHDVSPGWPEADAARLLDHCPTHIIRRHRDYGTLDEKGRLDRIHRHPVVLRAASLTYPLAFPAYAMATSGRLLQRWSRYDAHVVNARRSLALRRSFGRLFTNASGDFTLMHREDWARLGGYWEFPGFPLHVDGLLLYAARKAGLAEICFPVPACVYHLEHGEGSGYKEYRAGGALERRARTGLPYLDDEELRTILFQLAEGKRPVRFNGDNWGLKGETLPEIVAQDVLAPQAKGTLP